MLLSCFYQKKLLLSACKLRYGWKTNQPFSTINVLQFYFSNYVHKYKWSQFFFFYTEGEESNHSVKPMHTGLDPIKHLSTSFPLNTLSSCWLQSTANMLKLGSCLSISLDEGDFATLGGFHGCLWKDCEIWCSRVKLILSAGVRESLPLQLFPQNIH